MFSATVLSLTCKKLRILYKGLYEQHFGAEQRLWMGLGPTRSLGPVCLYLSYNYPDHTHRTMGSLLASWMPEGLIWDPQAGDFVRPEIFQATLESVCHGIQDLTDAKEKRHQERRGRNELERIALRDDRLSSYLAARSDRQLQRWVGEGSDEHDLDEDAMSDFRVLLNESDMDSNAGNEAGSDTEFLDSEPE